MSSSMYGLTIALTCTVSPHVPFDRARRVKRLAAWICGAVVSLLASAFTLSLIDSNPAWAVLFVLLYAGGLMLAFYVFVSIFADNIESQARSKIFVLALAATLSLYGISISMPGLEMGL